MRYIGFLILCFTFSTTFGQSKANEKFITRPLSFIENKGQITDQSGNLRKDIQYKIGGNGLSVFVGIGQLHYQFSKAENNPKRFNKFNHNYSEMPDTTPTRYTMYRLDMELEGANPDAKVIAEEKQDYYENYHTTALQTGCPGDIEANDVVSTYNRVTYKNIYPHIDWTLYIKDNQLEYDFIVNPGGNVNDIKIKYSGATDIAHNKENIKIKTPFGDVNEENLYAYEKGTGKQIAANFKLRKNTLGFSLNGTYDSRNTTLIIDPQLAWGLYFGGINREVAYGSTCDKYGYIYIAGFTKSLDNIATTGAYQTTYRGGEDAFLAKYNNIGRIIWSTYYGGESQDIAFSVACDKIGNVFITGETYSTTNISTPGSHQTIYGGQYDGFLAKFTSNGDLQWATYYGGTSDDIMYCVTCDQTGNIYLCGGGASSNNIATSGAYQDTIAISNIANAYIAKFTSDGFVIWATYFGLNTGSSGGVNCISDNKNNIYIVGDVYDTGVIATTGCYKSSDGFGRHVFISEFDSLGALKWSTYYGGDSVDYSSGIACDDSANIYITGLTNSTNGIASAGAYQTTFGGGESDVFIAKFNDTGAMQWSTYYGGNGVDVGNGITCDSKGNIYITGYTFSTSGIATTNGYQVIKNGSTDAFFTKFTKYGDLLWGSYYGGSSTDEGTSIATDGAGNIYISGYTASPDHIATLNNYHDSVTDSFHAFLVKFDTGNTAIKIMTPVIYEVQLFPSPNHGDFIVFAEFINTIKNAKIDIINDLGHIEYSVIVMVQDGILKQKININSDHGIYFLKLTVEKECKTIKFLIQ